MENKKDEIRKLIEMYEKDLEVITNPIDFSNTEIRIDALYDVLDILNGKTAEEVY